jgi:hypothetical protein
MRFDNFPPQFVVALVATVSWAIVTIVLGYPFVRSWARRMERRSEEQLPADVSARLARIESAVDSIAIEVERISESQRFLAKLQADRAPLSSGPMPPERQR